MRYDKFTKEEVVLLFGAIEPYDIARYQTPLGPWEAITQELRQDIISYHADILILDSPLALDAILNVYPHANITLLYNSSWAQKTIDGYAKDAVELIGCNIYNMDEVSQLMKKKKFDIVVGNPPYQDKIAANNKKLWREFFKLSFELCKDDGYVALITPNAWHAPGKEGQELFSYFKKYQPKAVCFDASEYFSSVGSAFTWYVIKKKEGEALTKIIGSEDIINFNEYDYIPVPYNKLTISILNKLLSGNDTFGFRLDYSFDPRKGKTNKIKNKDYIYTVKHSNNITLFSNEPHRLHFKKKVMFYVSGKTPEPIFDSVGEMGFTHNWFAKEVKNDLEGQNLCSYLRSNLVKFITKTTTYAMNMGQPTISKIPAVNLNKQWSDADLYRHFGLTKEEIEHVEKTVR